MAWTNLETAASALNLKGSPKPQENHKKRTDID
jgi:hypothetical protein